jgi:hypothetical protein
MIGDADTLGLRPDVATRINAYAKGALLQMDILARVSGLGYIYDDFNTVDDWIMIHGQLSVSGGDTSDVEGPVLGYAAGRHKTQLLSDNCRAKVTIQDGAMGYGESRVFICSDERMNNYYGVAINTGALTDRVSIIRGQSSISVDEYETVTVSVSAGDEYEVWYDRLNSTVRVYENGAQIAAKYFPPTDIPHGPGCRWTGVVMSARRVLDNGPEFDDFTATDVAYLSPEIHDAIDSLTVNPNWVEVLNEIEIHRHIVSPMTIGPKKTLWSESAARWDTPLSTASARAVFTAKRLGDGKFRLAVRSDAAMTNWVGVEFNGTTNRVRIVKGTAPNAVSYYGSEHVWIATHEQWTVTWDEDTEILNLYKGAETTPTLSWSAGAAFTGSGNYVGISWDAALATSGVEPSTIDVYAVTDDSPLPLYTPGS